MSSSSTTWTVDTNTKSGGAQTFSTTISSLKILGDEGDDAILKLFADEGDDNADQWRIVSSSSTNKLNFMSLASGSWANVLSLYGHGTAASQYLALQAGNKLYLDGGGSTYLQEASDGALEVHAATSMQFNTVTVDLNSTTEFNIDTVLYDLNASGAITVNGTTFGLVGTTIDIDGSGAMQINSSGGTIGIGNDDIDQNINIGTQGERTINIGTGSFADEVVIGNTTGASGVHLLAGTGDVQITGNLGIGVAAPTANLHVSGSGSQGITIGSTNAGGVSLALDGDSNGDGTGADYCYIQHDTAGILNIVQDSPSGTNEIRFGTAGTEDKVIIDASGKLGIGTTTPQAVGSVTGASAVSTDIGIFQVTTGTGQAASSKLTFGVVDTDYAYIQSVKPTDTQYDLALQPAGGSIGIGNTAPASVLHVTGTTQVGVDGTGHDVVFYSATAGDNLTWDASEEKLIITGTNGQTSLDVADGNVTIADDLAVDGTSNLDNTDIDGTFTMDGTAFDVNATTTLALDNTNTSNGVTINTVTSGGPISIGHATSETTVNDNLTVTGDLTVSGTTITVDSTTVAIADSMLKLAKDQGTSADAVDFGFYGKYGVGGTAKYAGIFRDLSATGDPFTFFDLLQVEPTTTVDTGGTGYDLADIAAGGATFADDVAVDGTSNLDNTDIDGTLVVDGSNISLDSTATFNIDCSNTSNGVTIATATSAVPISIGHGTSETTVNDNLTVTGTTALNDHATVAVNKQLKFGDGAQHIATDNTDLTITTDTDLILSAVNVGIGTTSPTSVLDIVGSASGGSGSVKSNLTVSSTQNATQDESLVQFQVVNGAFDRTVLDIINDGVGDSFTITDSDVERFTVLNGGNVGIATAAPDRALVVAKTSDNDASGTGGALKVCLGDDLTKTVNIGYDSSDYGFIEAVDESVAFKNLILCPTAGNVGIGTTTPGIINSQDHGAANTGMLHIKGAVPAIILEDTGDTDAQWKLQGQDSFAIIDMEQANTTETTRLIVLNSGNVGIGTTSPGSLLHVEAADGVSVNTHVATFKNLEATAGDSEGVLIQAGTSANDAALEVNNKAGTNIFKVRGDGNVGIGVASPVTALDIHSSGTEVAAAFGMADDGNVFVTTRVAETQNLYGAYTFMVGSAAVDGVGSSNTTAYIMSKVLNDGGALEGDLEFYTNTGDTLGLRMTIDDNGHTTPGSDNAQDFGASATAWKDVYYEGSITDTSDFRFKKDIVDTDLGLSFINALRPVKFKKKDDLDSDASRYGIIAQEVITVLQSLDKENDFKGIKTENPDRYGADYIQFIAPMMKAIQELSAKVTALENA